MSVCPNADFAVALLLRVLNALPPGEARYEVDSVDVEVSTSVLLLLIARGAVLEDAGTPPAMH